MLATLGSIHGPGAFGSESRPVKKAGRYNGVLAALVTPGNPSTAGEPGMCTFRAIISGPASATVGGARRRRGRRVRLGAVKRVISGVSAGRAPGREGASGRARPPSTNYRDSGTREPKLAFGGRRRLFCADFSYSIRGREKPLCSPECLEGRASEVRTPDRA
jgi:hypothetical protein